MYNTRDELQRAVTDVLRFGDDTPHITDEPQLSETIIDPHLHCLLFGQLNVFNTQQAVERYL